MDGWLKALIAAACVVMIAGGGYLGWTEYLKASERSARSAEVETARTAIFNQSGGRSGTPEARRYCENIRKLVRGDLKDHSIARLRDYQCRLVGL